jgi:hypothetical protein
MPYNVIFNQGEIKVNKYEFNKKFNKKLLIKPEEK